ncbi:MAG: B12-binding domain-containing radical SAM protein [Promethearchaeota archaeon]
MQIEHPTQKDLKWKKILLIKPNSRAISTATHFTRFDTPPLNLTFIASYIVDLDVEVEILDATVNNLDYKQIKKKIKKFNPDVVGITVFISAVINICYNIAKITKEINQNCLVVLGGRHPTVETEETLKVNEIDIIVRGEGELTFRELILKGTPENVKGISYKSNGKIIHNPDRAIIKDFGNIRYPARNLTKNNKYRIVNLRFETLQTSRGCPHHCKFCYTPIFNKGLWRPRPVEKIINELKMISQNRRITDIFFVDDNFTADTIRIERLCEQIIECKTKKEMNDFKFLAQVRADSIVKSPQMVKKMAEAGFWGVEIGIESVNEQTLREMKKGLTFNKILKALKILNDNNIIIQGSIIIGSDLNATKKEIIDEIKLIQKIDVDILASNILTPIPGTELTKELEEKKLIITKDWSKYTFTNPVIRTYRLTPKELQELLYYSFRQIRTLYKLRGISLKILRTRGLLFMLNPIRMTSWLNAHISINIIKKSFIKNQKKRNKKKRNRKN